jgi:hypothetical protein
VARVPTDFYPDLTNDRLRTVAVALLDMRYSTLREMNSPFDDNYTREAVVFGRQRNMLINMARDEHHPWMALSHAGMDVTFRIGSVPCRFFTDDSDSPQKHGFFRRNAVDDLFDSDDQTPVLWRFVIERSFGEQAEDQVFFVGYNLYQEKTAQWVYRASTPTLHSVDDVVPPSVDLQPAPVALRPTTELQDQDRKIGN